MRVNLCVPQLIVGSFNRPPNKGIGPFLGLEIEHSKITERFRNNPTLISGGDLNASYIDWEMGLYPKPRPTSH